MLDSDDLNTPAAATEEPARPPRRRAASRPAGPPAAVVASQTVPTEVAEPAVVDAEGEAVDEPDPEALPEAVTDEPQTAPEAEATELEAAEPEAAEPEPEVVEPVVTKPKRTRKPKTVAAAEVPADEVAPQLPDAEPVGEVETPAETPARSPRRRRRAAEPDAVTEAADETAELGLAASLEDLARTPTRTRTRKTAIAETFGMSDESSPDEVLDSLAAAIGGLLGEGGDSVEGDEDDLDNSEADGEGDAPRRRRRRRGGRRRRRGGAASDADNDGEGDSDAEGDEEDASADTDGDAAADGETVEDGATESVSSRRRRRRRRRGEDTGAVEDDSVDVIVRVREPRRRSSVSDEVTGIEGSTRMEAKKQRRREGRAAGRRRTPILSESEFLARRESVDRKMLIRQTEDYSQIAVLEDNVLVEHYVDRASATSMIGNIYLGRVQNVLPSMEAAFVDIGRGRNAVLYAGEVDWDSFGVSGADKKVEKVFKSGQQVVVQVSKDPVGAKGARLTSHLSIPGRYIVYSPGGHLSGISRKLPEGERKRLKAILDELIDPTASVIVRTAAEGASEDELVRDVNRLKAQWEVLEKKAASSTAPQLLYAEPDLTVRIVRDLFTEDFGSLVIDGNGHADDAYDNVEAYVAHVAPHLAERLERWDRSEKGDIFSAFRVHEQVAKALERKVFLPSGGSLIIDRTEAMTVIDVNTGKFTGTSGNLEATVTSNNLEAAEEIVRQLRLRDIGGIIVIDFIDMVLPANRELLLRRLVECLGRDRTRHQVAEVTSLGLVQMTRKKIGTGLAEAFTVACETCKGRGYHVHDAPVASQAPADGGERESRRRPTPKAPKAPAAPKPAAAEPAKKTTRTRKPKAAPAADVTDVVEAVAVDVAAEPASPVAEQAVAAVAVPEIVEPAASELAVSEPAVETATQE